MINFYSQEEFESQMDILIAQGMSYLQAYNTVRRREQQDALEYEQWLDAQAEEQRYEYA